jgi:hypothetical protein
LQLLVAVNGVAPADANTTVASIGC